MKEAEYKHQNNEGKNQVKRDGKWWRREKRKEKNDENNKRNKSKCEKQAEYLRAERQHESNGV